jgi:uncharacterized surface protein with fasciclin (FAS1) repeats
LNDQTPAYSVTVIVPDDGAWAKWSSANEALAADGNYTNDLMRYHFLQQSLVSGDFAQNSFFPHSLLNDTRYANVTGGQVVELTSVDNKPSAVSGLRAVSQITTPDIPFVGGWIQVTDTVLTIPDLLSSTISKLKLTHLLALLNKGGFVDPSLPSFKLVNTASDLSIFPPNNAQFGANYEGFDGLQQEEIRKVLNYSVVRTSPCLYSSTWKNGTKYPSLAAGLDVMFTQIDDDFYIDAAKLDKTDYLVANGVLQITESILNPNTTGIGPTETPKSETDDASSGLSSAAAAGIGIAVGAVILGLLVGGALYVRQRKRHNLPICGGGRRGGRRFRPGQQRLPEQDTPGIPQPVPRTIGGGGGGRESRNTRRRGYEDNPMGLRHTQSDLELAEPPPPHYGTHELDNKAYASPRESRQLLNGDRRRHSGQNVSVVEIHNPDGTVHTTTTRSTMGTYHSADSGNHTGTGPGGRNSRLDEPLPARPPGTPQEIDGRSVHRSGSGGSGGSQRTRINVTISGEQPRHLGFQAMY